MNNIKTVVIDLLTRGVSFLSDVIFRGVRLVMQLATGKKDSEVVLPISKKKQKAITIALIAVILLALLSIPLTTSNRVSGPKLSFDPAPSIGNGTADEVAKLMGDRGKILILDWNIPGVSSPGNTLGLESFLNALKKHGEITVVGTEKIPYGKKPPLGLEGEQYLRILEKYPDVDVIFSYAGLPLLTEEQINDLEGKKIPKFAARIGMSSNDMQIKELFEAQIIHLVIFPQSRRPPGARQPANEREFFEQSCMVITPENASSVSF